VIYIATSAYPLFSKQFTQLKILLASSVLVLTVIVIYGAVRLSNNPTDFTDIKVRLVQPSISQTEKWNESEFWHNLMLHINLSENTEPTDLIIWSEAALVVPFDVPQVKSELLKMLNRANAILITGGISDNKKQGDEFELYSAMYAFDKNGHKLFEYHKSHLVPFGEYMPLKKILPVKKLTHGLIDYKEGDGGLVYLEKYNLNNLYH
jgi:apolipoprotein N-acyltransferase